MNLMSILEEVEKEKSIISDFTIEIHEKEVMEQFEVNAYGLEILEEGATFISDASKQDSKAVSKDRLRQIILTTIAKANKSPKAKARKLMTLRWKTSGGKMEQKDIFSTSTKDIEEIKANVEDAKKIATSPKGEVVLNRRGKNSKGKGLTVAEYEADKKAKDAEKEANKKSKPYQVAVKSSPEIGHYVTINADTVSALLFKGILYSVEGGEKSSKEFDRFLTYAAKGNVRVGKKFESLLTSFGIDAHSFADDETKEKEKLRSKYEKSINKAAKDSKAAIQKKIDNVTAGIAPSESTDYTFKMSGWDDEGKTVSYDMQINLKAIEGGLSKSDIEKKVSDHFSSEKSVTVKAATKWVNISIVH